MECAWGCSGGTGWRGGPGTGRRDARGVVLEGPSRRAPRECDPGSPADVARAPSTPQRQCRARKSSSPTTAPAPANSWRRTGCWAKARSRPPGWRAGRDRRPVLAVAALTACGKTHAAFERRCIPAEPRLYEALCVAFRSEYARYSSLTRLVSRAPHRSRRSRGFHHRLLTTCGKTRAAFERRCIPSEPRLYEALCVAFRSEYTRYSSLTRLVSRAPHRSRRSRGFHHRLLTACGAEGSAVRRRGS